MRRIFRCWLGVIVVLAASALAVRAHSQGAPNLSRNQRAALQAVVRAIDTGTAIQDVPEIDWPVHVLRASDGSHYVAFSVATETKAPARPVVLYVRLATRNQATTTTIAERSAVAEWLAGQTAAPPPPRRGMAFGEMPTYGAGAIATRGPGPQSLQLLEMERERARERRDAEERRRREQLEGSAALRGPHPLLPFEDFDVRAEPLQSGNDVVFRRSLTAGPGDYDLVVGWADPGAKDPAASTRIVRRRLVLPPASLTEFALSSVIVANKVVLREAPLAPSEQTARPYSIGVLEITPARHSQFTSDESVTLVVQVVNSRGSASGKPDVVLAFRVFRRLSDRDEPIGALAPHTHNEITLPPDFETTKRHPLFDAVTLPLKAFRRGDYRVEIAATDRIAGIGTTADVTFTVIATPAALLRDAPPIAAPFRRDDLLHTAVIDELLLKLSSARPSDAFAGAATAARAGRFAELIRDDAVAAEERDARQLLRTLAMYAIGDTPASLVSSLQQSLQRNVPAAAVQLLLGGVRAAEGNDRDAVNAWNAAVAAGANARALMPLIVDALLRLGEAQRALDTVTGVSDDAESHDQRRLAAARLALGRHADALRAVDAALARDAADLDAQWLAIHTLFAGFVQGQGPGSDAAGRARIRELADRYVAAKGRHAALAVEWASAVK